MRIGRRCKGDCTSCRLGCEDRWEPAASLNETPNGSDVDDLMRLKDYLSEWYTAQTLIDEVRTRYDKQYLAFFGMPAAVESYLVHIRDSMRLSIDREDLRMLAGRITECGDFAEGSA